MRTRIANVLMWVAPALLQTLAGLEADMSGSVSAEDPQDLALLRQVWAVLGEGPFVASRPPHLGTRPAI